MSGQTRNTVVPEALTEIRRGAWTFHAPIRVDHAGDCFVFEAVRVGDHYHVWISSGRHVPPPARAHRSERATLRVGHAGKIIVRPAEWELLRGALDADDRIAVYEVEHPTEAQARRYAGTES